MVIFYRLYNQSEFFNFYKFFFKPYQGKYRSSTQHLILLFKYNYFWNNLGDANTFSMILWSRRTQNITQNIQEDRLFANLATWFLVLYFRISVEFGLNDI